MSIRRLLERNDREVELARLRGEKPPTTMPLVLVGCALGRVIGAAVAGDKPSGRAELTGAIVGGVIGLLLEAELADVEDA